MSIRFRTNKAYEIRLMVLRETPGHKLRSSDEVHKTWKQEVAKDPYFDQDKEHFYVFGVDARNNLKLIDRVSVGILDASLVHPREVFRKAIAMAAAAIILVHNHPGGDPTPSAEDIRTTRQLVEAGKIIDIKVMDHVVISNDEYVSMREHGIIQFD